MQKKKTRTKYLLKDKTCEFCINQGVHGDDQTKCCFRHDSFLPDLPTCKDWAAMDKGKLTVMVSKENFMHNIPITLNFDKSIYLSTLIIIDQKSNQLFTKPFSFRLNADISLTASLHDKKASDQATT